MLSLRQRWWMTPSWCCRHEAVFGSWNRRWLLVVVRRD